MTLGGLVSEKLFEIPNHNRMHKLHHEPDHETVDQGRGPQMWRMAKGDGIRSTQDYWTWGASQQLMLN